MIKLQEVNFIIFYTCFVLFVAYITGLAGISFFGEELTLTETNFDFAYNPFVAYSVFISLLISGLVPELTVIFTILFLPYIFGLAYIIWKALPFT